MEITPHLFIAALIASILIASIFVFKAAKFF